MTCTESVSQWVSDKWTYRAVRWQLIKRRKKKKKKKKKRRSLDRFPAWLLVEVGWGPCLVTALLSSSFHLDWVYTGLVDASLSTQDHFYDKVTRTRLRPRPGSGDMMLPLFFLGVTHTKESMLKLIRFINDTQDQDNKRIANTQLFCYNTVLGIVLCVWQMYVHWW